MRLYAATTNPGKLRDFLSALERQPVGGEPITIQPLAGLAEIPAPPEDEPTFEGNARAKAIYYSRHAPEALLLADDSGLEVMCLDDAPGVRSARYAEDQAQAHGRVKARNIGGQRAGGGGVVGAIEDHRGVFLDALQAAWPSGCGDAGFNRAAVHTAGEQRADH